MNNKNYLCIHCRKYIPENVPCPNCESSSEDPRKTGLKNGLRQLNLKQLIRVMKFSGEMVLDTYNYQDGKFCPLAIALELDQTMIAPTHDKVFEELTKLGFKVYNTRGILGKFYTDNRRVDLQEAAMEIFYEKINEIAKQEKCLCLTLRDRCGPCEGGYHIFCNHIPHGTSEEAYQWFIKHPEITKSIKPVGNNEPYEKALKEINNLNRRKTS